MKKKDMIQKTEKVFVSMAKKMAKLEANTTCPCLNYQKKETEAIKSLRKF